jgi:predicted N-formylglutamate amidohydrolase
MPGKRKNVRGLAMKDDLLISCEHGGNHIPGRYRMLFSGCEVVLQSHRGFDAGALAMARDMAKAFGAPLYFARTSRLLVDLNRSLKHPGLYSEVTRHTPQLRRELVRQHYLPYRNRIEADIDAAIERGSRVIHIASHSFTPELKGEVRNADIGLLYDPACSAEAALCRAWQKQLKNIAPGLKVRRNYPYQGRSDGLCTHLRRRFQAYIGIELEINQKHVRGSQRHWRKLRLIVIDALQRAMDSIART